MSDRWLKGVIYNDRLSPKDIEIKELKEKVERLNNILANMEEELMTIYLDIMEYNEDYAKREIKKLKGVEKNERGI